MKIDVSINGHEPNCVCSLCGEGRKFIEILRGSK